MYLLPDRDTSYIGKISTIFIISQIDPLISFIPDVSVVVVGFFFPLSINPLQPLKGNGNKVRVHGNGHRAL